MMMPAVFVERSCFRCADEGRHAGGYKVPMETGRFDYGFGRRFEGLDSEYHDMEELTYTQSRQAHAT